MSNIEHDVHYHCPSVEDGKRATAWGLAVLALTSIHHVYGAIVYATPWRYHAVHVSVVAAALMLASLAVWRRGVGSRVGTLGRWTLVAITAVVPILGIGAFEGLYNHVAKNLLFFGGAPSRWLTTLFPPPKYELPNNLIFEITGVLQVVPAVAAAFFLLRRARSGLERRGAG